MSGEPLYLQKEASKSRKSQSKDSKTEAGVTYSRNYREGMVSEGERAVGQG